MRCFRLFAAIVLLAFALASTGHCAPEPASPGSDLAQKLDSYINVDAVKRGFVGLLVRSLKDDRVLYEHNSTHILIPASCMKLLVTSATLDTLGPDFRLKTEVLSTGEVANGVLKGDLILKGYGDSSLDTKGLEQMADAVKAAGISRVSGDLVADDSYFDAQRFGSGWNWDYEPASYAGPIGALVLNHNTTDVYVKPGKEGEPVQVTFGPPYAHFQVENNAITGPAGTKAGLRVTRRRNTNVITVGGGFGADSKTDTTNLAVDDPTAWVGDVFLGMLKDRGIAIDGKLRRGSAPAGAKVVNTRQSEPLSSILEIINRHSVNVMAECLLKTLGAEKKGHGTDSSGIDAETEFLRRIGVESDEVNIFDGSGLSRCDMVSPSALVTILSYMYKSPNSKVWTDSLPVAGGDGTLYLSMRGTAAQGNLRAKTGNVGWVQTLAGYVNTKGGEPLVFALMVNNFKCSNNEIYRMRTNVGVALAELP